MWWLSFFAAVTAQASQPASRPGRAAQVEELRADLTMAVHAENSQTVTVEEFWRIEVPPGAEIRDAAAAPPLPAEASAITLDKEDAAFALADDGRSLTTKSALSGAVQLGVRYRLDRSGSTAKIERRLPYRETRVRVIAEGGGSVEIQSGGRSLDARERDMNGRKFRVFTLAPLPSGPWPLQVSGLPARSEWPKWAATFASLALILGSLWWVVRGDAGGPGPRDTGIGSLMARKSRIVHALRLLEAEYAAGDMKARRYESRRQELMGQLATILAQEAAASDAETGVAS